MNKSEIASRFTEIVAKTLDIYDQQQEGRYPPFDHDRWQRRYNGIPWDELPRGMVEYNRFRPVVRMTVAQLMIAMDDDEWEKANSPVPGLELINALLNRAIEPNKEDSK